MQFWKLSSELAIYYIVLNVPVRHICILYMYIAYYICVANDTPHDLICDNEAAWVVLGWCSKPGKIAC